MSNIPTEVVTINELTALREMASILVRLDRDSRRRLLQWAWDWHTTEVEAPEAKPPERAVVEAPHD